MTSRRMLATTLVAVLAAAGPALTASGGLFEDVIHGLDYAGFAAQGQSNPLSSGYDIAVGRNFNNTFLDFGATELTLTGPVGASFSIGGRAVRTLDFTFTAGTEASPLFYSYTTDIGANSVQVDGSTILDVTGSVNQFGWYDMTFQYSTRQTASSTGRFANTDGTLTDFDVGPIEVRGNLFADLLATITDPFFASAGYENIFASFSGRSVRENALESTVSKLQAKMAAGKNLTEAEVSKLMTMAMTSELRGDHVPDLSFLEPSGSGAMVTDLGLARAIPEPATVVLLLSGALLLTRRRRR